MKISYKAIVIILIIILGIWLAIGFYIYRWARDPNFPVIFDYLCYTIVMIILVFLGIAAYWYRKNKIK